LKTQKLTKDKKMNEDDLKPLERQLREYLQTKELEEENIKNLEINQSTRA